jgi:hypothetical protein
MSNTNILVIGAGGQVGTELVVSLREMYGNSHVIASDIKQPNDERLLNGPFEILDAMNLQAISDLVSKYKITEIYHLAALLSATAEKNPSFSGVKLKDPGPDWYFEKKSKTNPNNRIVINLSAFEKYGLDTVAGEIKLACYTPEQQAR